jgi:hypothetical protein
MTFPFRIPRTEVGKISTLVLQSTTAGLAPFSFMARYKAVQAGIFAAGAKGFRPGVEKGLIVSPEPAL